MLTLHFVYIEVDFTFGLPEYVRYIEVLFHTFYCNFGQDLEYRSFVISRTSLNRGSLNRGSTVASLCPVYTGLSVLIVSFIHRFSLRLVLRHGVSS